MHIKGDETLIKIQLWKVSWFVYYGSVYLCDRHVIVSYCTNLYVLCTALYRPLCVYHVQCIYIAIMYTSLYIVHECIY